MLRPGRQGKDKEQRHRWITMRKTIKKLIIHVDASYDWNKTDEEGCGVGTICLAIPETRKIIVEKAKLCFPGLKQLINRFELLAIWRALDEGKARGYKKKHIKIYSDSKVAVGWAKHRGVFWSPRDKNLAGNYLEFGEVTWG